MQISKRDRLINPEKENKHYDLKSSKRTVRHLKAIQNFFLLSQNFELLTLRQGTKWCQKSQSLEIRHKYIFLMVEVQIWRNTPNRYAKFL